MFERFTERSRQVIVLAQEEARALKHGFIGTEHLLLGLLRDDDAMAARALVGLGISADGVRAAVVRLVGTGEEESPGIIPFTPRAKNVCELALREALSLGHNYIGTEHILLGLVRENEGVAARILLDFDADSEKVRNSVIRSLHPRGPTVDEGARWAEYVTCRKRGHTTEEEGLGPHKRCTYCGTTYWMETVQRESGAPTEPVDEGEAA